MHFEELTATRNSSGPATSRSKPVKTTARKPAPAAIKNTVKAPPVPAVKEAKPATVLDSKTKRKLNELEELLIRKQSLNQQFQKLKRDKESRRAEERTATELKITNLKSDARKIQQKIKKLAAELPADYVSALKKKY